jgi:hypothetical protein
MQSQDDIELDSAIPQIIVLIIIILWAIHVLSVY